MSARVWTEEELDRVPLPEGWLWSKRGINTWCARKAEGGGWTDVWVSSRGSDIPMLHTEQVLPHGVVWAGASPPADVAFAVLLVAKGLDSYEAMTTAAGQTVAPELPPGYWIGDCEDGTWAIKVNGVLHDGLDDDDVPTSREEAIEVSWADWWNGASQEWREFMRRVGPPVLAELLQDDVQGEDLS